MARTTSITHKKSDPSILAPNDIGKPAIKFIKLAEVRALSTLSTSEIYRRMAAGTFPKQVMLGPKSAVWLEREVYTWCDERIVASRAEA